MRSGPHPLHVHLSLASASLPDNEMRAPALEKMVAGIQRYQNHPFQKMRSDRKCVMDIGRTCLFQIHAANSVKRNHQPIVLIPSLVNRSSILDLTEEHSFACWLTQQGFPVYLIDWGDICREDGEIDLDELVGNRLQKMLRFVHEEAGYKVHLLGYCMGGTLSMAAPVLWPDVVASLTLLASPWDMHAGENSLCKRVQFWAGSVMPGLPSKGYLPARWLQSLFASLDPEMTLHKFSRFVDVPEGSADETLFVAVEDWLNEGRDLPAKVAQNCIVDWFIHNVTARNEWKVCGRVIQPEAVQCPVLLIASKRDRLVAYESAVAAMDRFKTAQHVAPDCGHIGMMVGRNAKDQVWQQVADWVSSQVQ